MRISDWSSDVCSSDLTQAAAHGHRGRAAVGILAKQMDNRCLGQHLDKEPATGTTADQFISPSGKGVTNVAIDTSDRWPQHGNHFAEDFRCPPVHHGLIESHDQTLRSTSPEARTSVVYDTRESERIKLG